MSDIPVPNFPAFLADPISSTAPELQNLMPLNHIVVMGLIASLYSVQFAFAMWGVKNSNGKIEGMKDAIPVWFFFLTFVISLALGRWVDPDVNLPGESHQTTYQLFIRIYSSVLITFIIVELTLLASLVSLLASFVSLIASIVAPAKILNKNQDKGAIFDWFIIIICSTTLDILALFFVISWKLDKNFNLNPLINPSSLMYWILAGTSFAASFSAIIFSQSFLQKHHMGLPQDRI